MVDNRVPELALVVLTHPLGHLLPDPPPGQGELLGVPGLVRVHVRAVRGARDVDGGGLATCAVLHCTRHSTHHAPY